VRSAPVEFDFMVMRTWVSPVLPFCRMSGNAEGADIPTNSSGVPAGPGAAVRPARPKSARVPRRRPHHMAGRNMDKTMSRSTTRSRGTGARPESRNGLVTERAADDLAMLRETIAGLRHGSSAEAAVEEPDTAEAGPADPIVLRDQP